MVGGIFNNYNCIINNNTDGKNQSEKRKHVNGKAQEWHESKRTNNGDWNSGGRNQKGPPALQKH